MFFLEFFSQLHKNHSNRYLLKFERGIIFYKFFHGTILL